MKLKIIFLFAVEIVPIILKIEHNDYLPLSLPSVSLSSLSLSIDIMWSDSINIVHSWGPCRASFNNLLSARYR